MIIFFACLHGLSLICCPPKKAARVDGAELQGYVIAESYLERVSQKWRKPFVLSRYVVDFEGGWTYHFIPKIGPGEKYGIEYETSNGPMIRVKVDRSTGRVLSAVVE